jgi:Relaxase/Mobilisation nuclease domain
MSLVFKIFAPSASFHGVGYNDKKQKQGSAKLVYFENFGPLLDGRSEIAKGEFVAYFEAWSKRNTRVQNPQFHAMLSCKGDAYSHEKLKEAALEIMQQLGYTGVPTLIYAHSDTGNNHVHIVSSRVGIDGKKIKHDYEHKRANAIINQLLGIEPAVVYNADITKALNYRFTTVAQLALLMEHKGYNVKDCNGCLLFFKHGKEQGKMEKEVIVQQINSQHQAVHHMQQIRNQIKALLYKYAAKLDSRILKNHPQAYTSKSEGFSSQLTDYLKEKFGLEFVFFAGKDKDRPYGYAIIDHKSAVVFKGTEVMKMEVLDNLSVVNERQHQPGKNANIQPDKESFPDAKSNDELATGSIQFTSPATGLLPVDPLEIATDILNKLTGEGHSVQDTGSKSIPIRRRRKNSFF